MGTKYTTKTAPTYADDTPADDGSKVETNRISANLIRTNYTDPIKNLADEINTALVDHFDNGPRAVTSTDATVATDYGKVLQCTGTFTLSLLSAATAGAGHTFSVKNAGTGTVTLEAASGDTVDSITSGTVALRPEEARIMVVNSGATGYETIAGFKETPRIQTEQATTSGTAVDFTGIPAWVKRITIAFAGVSTDGTEELILILGDSGGLETSGYAGVAQTLTPSPGISSDQSINHFYLTATFAATDSARGMATLVLEDPAANAWAMNSMIQHSATTMAIAAGAKSLSGVLTQLRITTDGTPDTFDAGAINVIFE